MNNGWDEMRDWIVKVGRILEELSKFDGSFEDLCIMSEMEGEFDMNAEDMLDILESFIRYSKTFPESER